MRRYWVEPDHISEDTVEISGEVFHHIFDVCRQEKGSHFEVLDGRGQARLVEVIDVKKGKASAKILKTRELAKPPAPHLALALSIPRFPVFDAVIEKCVELGVHEIYPFFSDFSFVGHQDKISPSRMERWKKIVISATQQSGRGDLMKIHSPQKLSELKEIFNRDVNPWGLLAYEGETPVTIFAELKKASPRSSHEKIWLFVGGEGGFSTKEVSELENWGVKAVTLGEQVLRVETACITLVSILKYEIGHFGGLHESF